MYFQKLLEVRTICVLNLQALFTNILSLLVSKDQAWIGMSKHGESQGWKWADNSAVEFTHWATGEPSPSLVGTEDCVEMNQNGNWNNRDCSRQGMPFVCSHPRPWSNCMLAEIEKTPCGYPGIAEQVT